MPRVFNHHARKTLIVGKSGHGKSVYQIRAAIGAPHRLKFVFDHKDEFRTRAGALQCETPEEMDAALESGWIVFRPHRMFPGQTVAAFTWFCDFAWNLSEQIGFPKLMIADELRLLTDAAAPVELCRIMEDGRSVALDVLFTSHNANGLHNRVREQFTEVVTFALSSEPALEVMEREFEFRQDAIENLVPGEFIARNMETGQIKPGRVF
jgi:hypothetical protein